ncbi:glycoside hydrolase family 16 protein [Noviherbaspirillum sp.]|uniref:glycoside hydrolase family 16 protein n=1 Tax=Noviherbaspirillum sp. TaxID=1926288 RepID=UPI002D6C0D12|nr:glycoside hydrolase family 16 protein [Noviherbaspirillum sp.]HZW19964.1 glycoside hydrolase family 16 protein [Noviherbaspirillum sp.]
MIEPNSRVNTYLISAAVAGLLVACGGTSVESGAASAPDTSSTLTHAGVVSGTTDSPPQAAPPASASTANSSSPQASHTSSLYPATLLASGGPTGQDPSGYRLTFHDSFDAGLDRSIWNTERTDADIAVTNYAVKDGTLKIWPERGTNGKFFNRTFDTDGRFSQQYGYFEMEAKLPKGKGVWPAFWLLGYQDGRRPEIDILEAYPGGAAPWGAPGEDGIPVPMMYAPVVWIDRGDRAGYSKVATPDLSAGFHRYGLKWEPDKATFYFDGKEVYSLQASITDPLFPILDLWFGSASGDPDDTTPTGESNAFEINYVKAWQFE